MAYISLRIVPIYLSEVGGVRPKAPQPGIVAFEFRVCARDLVVRDVLCVRAFMPVASRATDQ